MYLILKIKPHKSRVTIYESGSCTYDAYLVGANRHCLAGQTKESESTGKSGGKQPWEITFTTRSKQNQAGHERLSLVRDGEASKSKRGVRWNTNGQNGPPCFFLCWSFWVASSQSQLPETYRLTFNPKN